MSIRKRPVFTQKRPVFVENIPIFVPQVPPIVRSAGGVSSKIASRRVHTRECLLPLPLFIPITMQILSPLRTFCCVLLLSCCALCGAQTPVSPQRAAQMVAAITSTAASTSTLRADFVQTKSLRMLNHKLTARGRVVFAAPARLRWEYLAPTAYVLVIDGEKVTVRSGKNKHSIDTRQSQIFAQIAQIMSESVTGRSLADTRRFAVRLFDEGNTWTAELTPRNGALKRLFATVRLRFDAKRRVVTRVDLVEHNGDATVIEMQGVLVNQRLDAHAFQVD